MFGPRSQVDGANLVSEKRTPVATMADKTAKRRQKPSEPRTGHKSSSTTFFAWLHPQAPVSTNAAENEILRDQKIAPILAGIQSTSPVDKTQHLVAASSMIQEPACRKLLLRGHIVKILVEQSLLDFNHEVVTAAWNLLDTLTRYEGYDVAVHLYRMGILKVVEREIANNDLDSNIHKFLKQPGSIDPAWQASIWNRTYSLISFLTSLCETTKEILEALSSKSILRFCSRLLDQSIAVPPNVQAVVVLFLDRLTDQNENAYALLTQEEDCIRSLSTSYNDAAPLLAVAACSTLHNLISLSHVAEDDFVDINNVTEEQITQHLSTITKTILLKQAPSHDDQRALFIALETLSDITDLAVEAFGSKASSDPNGVNGEVDEMDEDEEGDEVMDEGLSEGEGEGEDVEEEDSEDDFPHDLEDDMAMVTGEEGTSTKIKSLNSEIFSYLATTTTTAVLPITTSTPSSETERNIKLTAISLISSIAHAFATLSSKPRKSKFKLSQSHIDTYLPVTHNIWNTLITPVLLSNSADITLAEKITELSIHITEFAPSVDVSKGQHKAFLALYNAAEASTSLRVSCVQVLSRLAQCQGTDRIEINKEIGTFFISTVNKLPYLGDAAPETLPPAEVVVECLNAIYDVYADKEFDYDEEVFVKLGFLKYLKTFAGRVRGMAKRVDKRKNLELRESIDEAILNLNAFIKYKTEEREEATEG